MRTGYRLAIATAGVTLLIAATVAMIEALKNPRDADAYGSVPVPGRESITLPADHEVIVYYGQGDDSVDGELVVPPSLRLAVRTTNGQQLLGSTAYAFDQFADGDLIRRPVAKLKVPEAGPYEAVTPTRVPGASDPEISFGNDSTRNYGYALFVLAGGLLLAAILAAITALRTDPDGEKKG